MEAVKRTGKLFPLRAINTISGNNTTATKEDVLHNVVPSQKVQLFIDAAYAVAITSLWNGELLSPAAQQIVKSFIRSFLLRAEDRQHEYTVLVERILMARAYVLKEEGRYIPAPEVWLDSNSPKGFAGTERWWKRLAAERENFPLFRQDMKVIAEAVQDMLETPTAKNFHYWRLYFIEREWQGQLSLWLAIIANMQNNVSPIV